MKKMKMTVGKIMKRDISLLVCFMLILSMLPVSMIGQTTQSLTEKDVTITPADHNNIGAYERYDEKTKQLTNAPVNSEGQPNPELTPAYIDNKYETLKQLGFDKIKDNKFGEFLKKYPGQEKDLAGKDVTRSEYLRGLLRNPEFPDIFKNLKNEEKISALKEMNYKDVSGDLTEWRWDNFRGDYYLRYDKNGPKINMDKTNGFEVKFEGGKATIKIKGSPPGKSEVLLEGSMEWKDRKSVV